MKGNDRKSLIMCLIMAIFAVFLFFAWSFDASAAAFTSTINGNFSDGGTWGNASPGVEGVDYPGSSDTATISNGTTVTFNENDGGATSQDITINSGGKLLLSSGGTVTMNVNGDINVNGELEMDAGSNLYIQCVSAGEHGIIVNNGGSFIATGSTLTNVITTTTSAINGGSTTQFTVAGDISDWPASGAIVVASTSATGETERANITGISGSQITVMDAFSNGHVSGAVVGRLTRDVKVGSLDSLSPAYLLVNDGGTLDLDYVELSYIGTNASDKYGVTLKSTASATPLNGSSLHDNYSGIYFNNAQNLTVQNNVIYNMSASGVSFGGGSESGNTLTSSIILRATNYGVSLNGSNNTISNNSIIDNPTGILTSSGSNTISGNTIQVTTSDAIQFAANVSKMIIDGNAINRSIGTRGIQVGSNGDNNVFKDNTITDAGGEGLLLNSSSNGNYIIGNTIYSNNDGVEFESGASNNFLLNNSIYLNNYGIDADGATGNNIYADNFGSSGANTSGDIFFTGGSATQLTLFNTTLASTAEVVASGIDTTASYVLSRKHDQTSGVSRVWGDYNVSSGTETHSYASQLYASSASTPLAVKGSSAPSLVTTSDSVTPTDYWTVTYSSGTGVWTVVGRATGTQTNTATTGNAYTSDNGEVQFTISSGDVPESNGDKFVFITNTAASDTNTQKRVQFGPCAAGLNSGKSKLTVANGAAISIGGAASNHTLLSGIAADNYYDVVINGTLNASYFQIDNISSAGFSMSSSATISALNNGIMSSIQSGGAYLIFSALTGTFDSMTFNGSTSYNVQASNSANVVFTNYSGNYAGSAFERELSGAVITWSKPPVISNISASQRTDGSKLVDVIYTGQDDDGNSCIYVTAQYDISDDDFPNWTDMTRSGSGSAQFTAEGASLTYVWNVGEDLSDTRQDVQVRLRVNDGYLDSNTPTSVEFTIDTRDPLGATLTVDDESISTLDVTIGRNAAESMSSEYLVHETTTDKYIQSNGKLGDGETWRTYTGWGGSSGITVSSLSSGETYTFEVKARNPNDHGNMTAYSAKVSGTTQKDAPTISANLTVGINTGPIPGVSSGFKSIMGRLLYFFSLLTNPYITILIIVLIVGAMLYSLAVLERDKWKVPKGVLGTVLFKLKLFFTKNPYQAFRNYSRKTEEGTWIASYALYKKRRKIGRTTLFGGIIMLVAKIFAVVGVAFLPMLAIGTSPYKDDGKSVVPTEYLSFRVDYKNSGAGRSTGTKIANVISGGTDYVTGSAVVNGVVQTDTSGDDETFFNSASNTIEFNLGTIGTSEDGYVVFRVRIKNPNMETLVADAALVTNNQATAFYTNKTNNSLVLGSIGKYVYKDKERNSVYEKEDTGISGVGLMLYEDSDNSGTLDVDSDNMLDRKETDASGIYNFTGLGPITYFVKVDSGTLGSNYVLITNNDPLKVNLGRGEVYTGANFGYYLSAVPLPVTPTPTQTPAVTPSPTPTATTGRSIVDDVVDVLKNISEIKDKPIVQEINQNVVVPAVAAVVLANIAAVATLPNIISFFIYLQQLFVEPFIFLGWKKKKPWGVVYNSLNKQPVALAVVRLFDAKTKRLLKTVVTDRLGRFRFLVKSGRYYLIIAKHDFEFPSSSVKEKGDTFYKNIYVGGNINVGGEGLVNINVPIDPLVEAGVEAGKKALKKFSRKKLTIVIAFTGMVLALVSLWISPNLYTAVFFGIDCCILALFLYLLKREKVKPWGIVYDAKTKKPLSLAIVRIFNMQYEDLLETQITDRKGRYGFLLGPGRYRITVDRENYSFPSKIERYGSYRGKEFLVRKNREAIPFNIPMDIYGS